MDFEKWLKRHKEHGPDWPRVLAGRAALRAFPYVLRGSSTAKWVNALAFGAVRANAISWAARNYPAHDMAAAAYAAARAAYAAAADAAYADARAAARAADAAAAAAYADARAAARAADAAADAADAAAAARAFWSALDADCQWLEARKTPKGAAQILTGQPLWPSEPPEDWADAWTHAKNRLRALDDQASFQVWIDWYERRFTGQMSAFDIPGDNGRRENNAILARLADATDEDFWGYDATHVNTMLQQWIDEARERVAPRREPVGENDFAPNSAAVAFGQDETGRIRVDAASGAGALRTDDEAADRRAEAMYEAQNILDRYRMSNAAAGAVQLLERYILAGGDSLAGLKPSLFVQRGERLRQFVLANSGENRDALLNPASEELVLDLQGWQSAHNMAVGLDPFLSRMESATLGPDLEPALIESREVFAIAAEADEAGILSEGTREIIEEAASLAPEIPDAQNRRSVWTAEMMTNFAGEIVAILAGNPVKSAVAISAVVGTVSAAPAYSLVTFGLGLTAFTKKRQQNLLKSLERYPACQAILRDILREIMPEDGQSD